MFFLKENKNKNKKHCSWQQSVISQYLTIFTLYTIHCLSYLIDL